MGLEAGIWASRLGFEEKEEKEEEEKIPHMFESIGHQPLRSHCPTSALISNITYLGRA